MSIIRPHIQQGIQVQQHKSKVIVAHVVEAELVLVGLLETLFGHGHVPAFSPQQRDATRIGVLHTIIADMCFEVEPVHRHLYVVCRCKVER